MKSLAKAQCSNLIHVTTFSTFITLTPVYVHCFLMLFIVKKLRRLINALKLLAKAQPSSLILVTAV